MSTLTGALVSISLLCDVYDTRLVNEAYMSQNRPDGVLTPGGGGRSGGGSPDWMKSFGVNLTEQAKSGRFSAITGRDEEIEQITSVRLSLRFSSSISSSSSVDRL